MACDDLASDFTSPRPAMRLTPALFATLLAVMPVAAAPLVAQTTPTERTAAAPVLTEIEALQTRLAPAPLAKRMAERASADRDKVMARVEANWTGGMQALSDWIGHHPE